MSSALGSPSGSRDVGLAGIGLMIVGAEDSGAEVASPVQMSSPAAASGSAVQQPAAPPARPAALTAAEPASPAECVMDHTGEPTASAGGSPGAPAEAAADPRAKQGTRLAAAACGADWWPPQLPPEAWSAALAADSADCFRVVDVSTSAFGRCGKVKVVLS